MKQNDLRPSNYHTANTASDAIRLCAEDRSMGYDSVVFGGMVMSAKELKEIADNLAADQEIKVEPATKVSQPADGGGLRFDAGKNRLDLIPPEWVWGLGKVLTKGAQKYDARNWERGMDWSKCVGCALRHTFKFACGERYDEETGCHHLAMAAWNMLALMSYDIRGIGQNDLVGDMKWILKTTNDK